MIPCPTHDAALHAYLDDELDSLAAAAFEAHARTCSGCTAALAEAQALRTALAPLRDETAAPHLHRSVAAMLEREAPVRSPTVSRALPWLGGGTIGALAASLAFMLSTTPLAVQTLPDELVASHVRSLEANHLVDVATSDRHTVKPWFNGKLDFAPPVADLTQAGFPLVGGRLDYVGDRHTINLFMCARTAANALADRDLHHASYALVHWQHDGLEYWAVSDTDMVALRQFRTAFEGATGDNARAS